jgi:hypothetical protein
MPPTASVQAIARQRAAPAVRAMVRGEARSLIVGVQTALIHGIGEAFEQLPSVIQSMGNALAVGSVPDKYMQAANYEIAAQAQRAIVGGLRNTLPEGSGPYRAGERLTGTLERALSSPAMLEHTTGKVISFINESVLNSEARHWYRINYGVAGTSTQGPSRQARSFDVTLNGTTLMTLRDARPPRSGGTYLPRRFRFDGREMVVLSGPAKPPRPGHGARAAHFIDLGLEAVAENTEAYERVFRRWVDEEGNRAKLARKNINVAADLRLQPMGAYSVRTTHH